MNRFRILLFLTGLLVSVSLSADEATARTITACVETLSNLQVALESARRSEKTPNDLKRFEIELQKGAERFFAIANSEQKRNGKLAESIGVSGRLIVDSAYIIFQGNKDGKSGVAILKDQEAKASILPNLYLGVINELIERNETERPLLTKNEIEEIRNLTKDRFRDRISYSGELNGDNGFSKTASLIDSCLLAIANTQ